MSVTGGIFITRCLTRIDFFPAVHNGGCSTNPCQNNGHCIETTSGFDCMCRPGYSGTVCSGKVQGLFEVYGI
jgi:hypothetical protein